MWKGDVLAVALLLAVFGAVGAGTLAFMRAVQRNNMYHACMLVTKYDVSRCKELAP